MSINLTNQSDKHPIDMLSDAEMMRYSRQILLDGWDIDAQLRLKNSTIAIIGMGGLGAMVTPVLVRAGVGVVHLFDHDTVDDSNLQRQLLYTTNDIGKPKVLCAKQALSAQNILVDIHAHHTQLDHDNIVNNLHNLHADLWIDCSDNFTIRTLLNQTSLQLNTPLLSLSAIAEVGQAALFEPNKTGCYTCVFGTPKAEQANCATSGVLASTVAMIGALGADVALHYLGKDINTIANQLVIWHGARASLQKMQFIKNPTCPTCAN